MHRRTNSPTVAVESAEDHVHALHALLLAEARQDVRREIAAEAVDRVAGDDVTDAEFAEVVAS